jgi:hypothetical protein
LNFQSHVIDLFEKLGYMHIRTVDNFISADYSDDEEGNIKSGILVEDTDVVDAPMLSGFYSKLVTQGFDSGWVVTSGLFTKGAIDFPNEFDRVKITLIDGVAIKKIEEKLKDYPHSLRYNIIWGFKRVLDILWLAWFIWVSYGVFLECRLDRHYWIVVDIINGIMGGVFFIYPFTLYRQDLLKVMSGWLTYLVILFVIFMLALMFSSIMGWPQ